MSHAEITDDDIDELVRLNQDAASAIIRGDMKRYLELIHHADDYTLMPPSGGETRRGFDRSEENVAEMARFFRNGEAEVELVQTYASGDLVVLVVVERQHGEVGDLPDRDWSLRVTLVFRRAGTGWELAHRHADLLVNPISLEQAAALTRGSDV